MKIKQFVLNKNTVIKGINFIEENDNINIFRIRVRAPYDNFKSGLFINNNPYLIHPIYNNKQIWEFNTRGNLLISSIKFDFETKNSLDINFNKVKDYDLIIEIFYED